MGLIFGRNNADEKFARLHNMLSDSFAKVKQDSALLSQWVEYLYHLSIEQQRSMNDVRVRNTQLQSSLMEMERYARRQNDMIRELQLQLKHMPSSRDEIKKIVDSFYSFEPILARLKHVESKLGEMESLKSVQHQISSVQVAQHSPKEQSLKEKILRRITRNSKNFIKNSILSLLAKYGKISALQMREIIVEEQGLCSKSSFYRLLEELEASNSLHSVSDGKEKVYFAENVHSSHLRAENSK